MGVDAEYELNRTPPEPRLYRKLKLKRLLSPFLGEPYLGRRVKLRYFSRMMLRVGARDGWRIMDSGSGDGTFAFYAARRFPRSCVVGLELNCTEVRVCNRLASDEGLTNLTFVEAIPETYRGKPFDLIYCLDVLEHIRDDVSAVRAMRDNLRPGGVLLAHVPSRYYMETDGRLHTVPDEEAWKINPGHVRNGYTPDEMFRLLQAAGLSHLDVVPTQGRPIAYANRLARRVERFAPLKLAILPIVDLLTLLDMRGQPSHGNTIWGIGRRPIGGPAGVDDRHESASGMDEHRGTAGSANATADVRSDPAASSPPRSL